MITDLLTGLVVVAAEGIPPESLIAQLVVPLGVLVFLGSVYLLLRANLGTRRGYLVMGTSLFGFMIILSAFWTFGAPGTPQATGPQNLPGQPSDHYVPTWTPFAIDSRVAEDPRFQFVQQYPADFGEVPPDFEGEAANGVEDIQAFFASEDGGQVVGDDWEPSQIEYAEAPDGHPVLAVTYAPPEGGEEAEDPEAEDPEAEDPEAEDPEAEDPEAEDPEAEDPEAEDPEAEDPEDPAAEEPEAEEAEEPAVDQDPVTLFGFFDEGSPLFPGFVFIGISLVGFALHAFLLSADEARERREAAEVAEERERVPAGA